MARRRTPTRTGDAPAAPPWNGNLQLVYDPKFVTREGRNVFRVLRFQDQLKVEAFFTRGEDRCLAYFPVKAYACPMPRHRTVASLSRRADGIHEVEPWQWSQHTGLPCGVPIELHGLPEELGQPVYPPTRGLK